VVLTKSIEISNENDGYRLSAINQKAETWGFNVPGSPSDLKNRSEKAIGEGRF
jgi:hypothetical protein